MHNKTALNDHSVEAWRWNVNPAWTNFSAMIQDNFLFGTAQTEFERHRTSKSCLYFGVAAVEAFINQELREFMRQEGQSDDAIIKILPGGKNKGKWLKKTPFGILYSDNEFSRFEYYKEIRNEVTHPVRKDQLIADYLNIVKPQEFVDMVKYLFVKMCELQDKPFQYWMLGWNYIGCNHNDLEPFLGNNLNGFYHSLVSMRVIGYDFTDQSTFSDRYLKGYTSFLALQKSLDNYPFDIETERSMFLQAPRLTRKWWDKKVILPDNGDSFADDPNNNGCKLGWAVLSTSPHQCAGFFDSEEKAAYVCLASQPGFEVKFASHNPQTNEVKPLNSKP